MHVRMQYNNCYCHSYFIASCVSFFSLAYSDELMPDSSLAENTRQIDRTSVLKPIPWKDTNHFQDQSLSLVRHSFQGEHWIVNKSLVSIFKCGLMQCPTLGIPEICCRWISASKVFHVLRSMLRNMVQDRDLRIVKRDQVPNGCHSFIFTIPFECPFTSCLAFAIL